MGERTFNHRRRLQKIAGKHGVLVANVCNWHDLAMCLELYFHKTRPAETNPRQWCFDMMESRRWIPPKGRK